MSKQYPGGIISKTAPVPSGPYSDSTAPGIWTLDQQAAYAKLGQWPTAGNANPNLFIESLFQTWVYTGNGSTQTITNGTDLSGQGGMVWFKNRSNAFPGNIFDTVRNNGYLTTATDGPVNAAGGGVPPSSGIASFNNNGFTIADGSAYWNSSSQTYVSWTFRKQPKFFDVVTYTGTGTTNIVAHSLASVPGAIFIKRTSSAADWRCLCKNGTDYSFLQLNTTSGDGGTPVAINLCATSTTLDIGYIGAAGGNTPVNTNGETYVAYIFAHNAGGFGLSGSENVITCGSSSVNSAGNDIVDLGFEPQWVLIKPVGSSGGNWQIRDIMRNFNRNQVSGASLFPNLNNAETASSTFWMENSTGGSNGFRLSGIGFTSQAYIYIAIRRGLMAVPTVGTSVFSPQVQTLAGGANNVMAANSNFPIDWLPTRQKNIVADWYQTSRLTNNYMSPNQDYAEASYTYGFDRMSGVGGGVSGWNANATVSYAFRRAPGFFDVVCYTGNLSNRTVTHNLGVAPEMMIVKCRSSSAPGGIAANWAVYAAPQGNSKFALLNTTDLFGTSAVLWQATTPTASNFYVGAANYVNGSGETYVAYLFATCPGVSKVGTYTGTGALLTVDCGFTTGARFILIKRADTSGDWWLYNSASGLSSGNDPYLVVNSQAAEVTGTNYVDTDTTGFKVTAAAPAGLNANGGTYIFLAIA